MKEHNAFAKTILWLSMTLALLATSAGAAEPLVWSELPPIPNELGVAGPFAGTHNGALIVAGGANFPKPIWETDKVWHDNVFVLTQSSRKLQWKAAGKLARKMAYGAAVSTADGVVCMGGNDGKSTFDEVFLLRWNAESESISTKQYPSLPEPCAYGAATMLGDVIYLAGGQSDASLDSAMTNFWMLDLTKRNTSEFAWQTLPAWPGAGRAFNLTVGQRNGPDECVYVISGRRQNGDDGKSVSFLTDVWEYTPKKRQWRRRRDVPRCVMAGTAVARRSNKIFVLGGADGSLFFKTDQLKDNHPGFPNRSLVFDTVDDRWNEAGETPRNHVTTIAFDWNGAIIIPSGEVRPRVRSPKVWRVSEN